MKRKHYDTHWSKDHVEHIRTVHFSLIAVSLAVIVLASSGTPAEVTLARQQIQDIADVTRDRVWEEMFLEQGGQKQLDGDEAAKDFGKIPSFVFKPNFGPMARAVPLT